MSEIYCGIEATETPTGENNVDYYALADFVRHFWEFMVSYPGHTRGRPTNLDLHK